MIRINKKFLIRVSILCGGITFMSLIFCKYKLFEPLTFQAKCLEIISFDFHAAGPSFKPIHRGFLKNHIIHLTPGRLGDRPKTIVKV